MYRPKAILLDWGGTLVSSPEDPTDVYIRVLADRGISVDRAAVERGRRIASGEFWPEVFHYVGRSDDFWREMGRRTLVGAGVADPNPELCEATRVAFRSARWYTPYPESTEVLAALRRRGFALHIVSNNTDDLSNLVSEFGWASLFSTVTCSQEAGAEKPDGRVFTLAIQRSGCRPIDLLHVGDSIRDDVQGARARGLAVVWLNRRNLAPQADCPTITDLRGLLTLLDGTPAREP